MFFRWLSSAGQERIRKSVEDFKTEHNAELMRQESKRTAMRLAVPECERKEFDTCRICIIYCMCLSAILLLGVTFVVGIKFGIPAAMMPSFAGFFFDGRRIKAAPLVSCIVTVAVMIPCLAMSGFISG